MNSKKSIIQRALYFATAFACIAEVFIIFLSWMLCTVYPEIQIRSLLSDEGIRWLFGHITDNISGAIIIYIIMVGMACGAIKSSGFIERIKRLARHKEEMDYRDKMAFITICTELTLYILSMILLAFTPHATLLSATGNLYPSSFSVSIIPSLCSIICLMMWTFAFFTKSINSIYSCISSLVDGIKAFALLIVAYIFICQLIQTLYYIFSI